MCSETGAGRDLLKATGALRDELNQTIEAAKKLYEENNRAQRRIQGPSRDAR